LLAARRLALKLTIVLLNNGGGGIFDFLPVSRARMALTHDQDTAASAAAREQGDVRDIYTRHVATPTGLDFAAAAALYGLSHERVADVQGFRAALERTLDGTDSSIIEVRGERAANVELHERLWAAVSGSLGA
jgi:2-succinyl-5-enolpyruvyl-6-hydroxy-3-cyclohexene-1-carboxylate synthase